MGLSRKRISTRKRLRFLRHFEALARGVGWLFVGWLASISAIAVIAVIAVESEERSAFFWHRVLWTQFLATLLFAAGLALTYRTSAQRAEAARADGALPALGLVVVGYAACSCVVMLVSMVLSDAEGSPSRSHLVVQICLAVVAVVLCTWLLATGDAVAHELNRWPQAVPAPPQLARQIGIEEDRLKGLGVEWESLVVELKRLRERVSYSLSRRGSLAVTADYVAFTGKVVELCVKLAAVSNAASIPAMVSQVRALQRDVDSIAQQVKR